MTGLRGPERTGVVDAAPEPRGAGAWPVGHPDADAPRVRSPRPRRRRPLLVGEIAVVLFLLVGYDRIAAFAGGRAGPAVARGRHVLAVETRLHVAVEQRLDHALAGLPDLGRVLSVYYDFAHGLVTFGVLGVLYLCRPRRYRPARRALVALNVGALAVFAALPVAPPRLLPGGGFTDIVAGSGTWGAWETSTSSVAQHADLYAAFPSLHVAQATWVLLAVVTTTRRRSLRALAAVHLTVTVLVVLSTGNHYVVDVAGGAALSLLSWWAVQSRAVWLRSPVAVLARHRLRPAD